MGADLVYSAAQVEPLVGLLAELRAAGLAAAAAVDEAGCTEPALGAGLTASRCAGAAAGPQPGDDVPASAPMRTPRASASWLSASPPPSPPPPSPSPPPRCRLLLAHKQRSEALTRRLLGALAAAGVALKEVALGVGRGQAGCGAEGVPLQRLAGRMPSVALYEGALW
ncbi:hypothetical protein GPECTOR_7g1265 [Gonium pectorale]|uniref:Uncharacterized protein n=1 Tax=Gonium pectorale TaxID=33097 RepID=A0A150GU53_GONPE|nr:hypothetical protein GPECTOR_7g1265 [Gonium pectorale]|eukprot:KXZ53369.1 hypothetical protein GPECTOR_7g1265 [Gonium pectorale]